MKALNLEEFKALIQFAIEASKDPALKSGDGNFDKLIKDLLSNKDRITYNYHLDQLRGMIPNFDVKMNTSAIFNQTIQQLVRGQDPVILLDETIIRLEDLQKKFEDYIMK